MKPLLTAAVLCALSAQAYAVDRPPAVQEKLLAAGSELTAGVRWPSTPREFGFKSLWIGDEIDLEGAQFLSSFSEANSFPTSANEPFMCGYRALSPFFDCNVTLWNGGENYSKELQELERAFGEKVTTRFNVLLDKPLTLENIRKGKVPHGKIFAITVKRERPSSAFIQTASQFFSEKLGTTPSIRRTYLRPDAVYSSSCVAIIERVNDTPASLLSTRDVADRAACEAQAATVITSGKAFSSATVERVWRGLDERYVVTITTTETDLKVDGDRSYPVEDQAEIKIALNSDAPMNAWSDAFKRIDAEWRAEQKSNAKSDF